ncbi:MAG: DUF3656 domain-containing U32 family peptidase [Limnochordia bacterium]|jgi:putative protease
MEVPELLAPAGSFDALKAAVQNGADAVYLGGQKFSARANAANFDEEEMKQAVEYCHLYGVHLYVTINTLLNDREMEEVSDYLAFLEEIGVDGIIVQDLGLARLIHHRFPGLPLHASTQMTVHNVRDLKVLEELGFTRVIPARELTLEEIETLCRASSLEIEVFAHGALCISYSGQCLFSSMVGGRSGNRGRCAQPCRLEYALLDEGGQVIPQSKKAGKYLLSTRDLNLSEHLAPLAQGGVRALKIEGRMRQPEYVAVVVKTYRAALDALAASGQYELSPKQRQDLAQVFNRDFTTGHLFGRQRRGLMGFKRPNNRGTLLGRIDRYDVDGKRVYLKLEQGVSQGDEVEVWVSRGGRVQATIQRIIKDGEPVSRAEEGEVVALEEMVGSIRAGDRIFKTIDRELLAAAQASYRSPRVLRKIPVDVRVRAYRGESLQVIMTDRDGRRGQGSSDTLGENARKRPLTPEIIEEQMARLGNVPFSIASLEIDLDQDVMVPFSEINKARHRAVEDLMGLRVKRNGSPLSPVEEKPYRSSKGETTALAVHVADWERAQAAAAGGAHLLYFGGEAFASVTDKTGPAAWREQERILEEVVKLGPPVVLILPRLLRNEELKEAAKLLEKARQLDIGEVVVGNLGALDMAQEIMGPGNIIADYSFNAFNSRAIEALGHLGVKRVTLSPELTLEEVGQLAEPYQVECIIHGHLPLMVTDYCIPGALLGAEVNCPRPCRGRRFSLRDRKGFRFPIEMDSACRMHIYNSKILSMLDHLPKFRGVDVLRILGTTIDVDQLEKTTRAYVTGMKLAQEGITMELPHAPEERTTGHYFRGVL